MTWSTHSRRIDPIIRSAKPCCQGDADVMGLSLLPVAHSRRMMTLPQNDTTTDLVAIAEHVARLCLSKIKCGHIDGAARRELAAENLPGAFDGTGERRILSAVGVYSCALVFASLLEGRGVR